MTTASAPRRVRSPFRCRLVVQPSARGEVYPRGAWSINIRSLFWSVCLTRLPSLQRRQKEGFGRRNDHDSLTRHSRRALAEARPGMAGERRSEKPQRVRI